MVETNSFKCLILAVLREVSPMVIRLVSVPDELELPEFHKIFCRILGWSSDLGYIFRLHGQEFNSFRRKTRSKRCTSSGCTGRRSSCVSATRSICGNGTSGYSTFRTVSRTQMHPFVWAAAALPRPSFAAVPLDTG